MTTAGHTKNSDSPPRALITPRQSSWAFWLVPLAAAGLCVWFAGREFVGTGPTIKITFQDADGVEAKNTPIKFRGVKVGEVKSITVSGNNQHAVVTVKLTSAGRNVAHAGSIFWIVRPELNVGSITGLGTIVSGNYITVRPGNGPTTNEFTGAEREPPPELPTALAITLLTHDAGSLQENSPIFYRGIQVGQVLQVGLGPDSRNIVVSGRVWEDYAPLVRPESKFWNAGGLEFHVGLFNGLEVNAKSPKTIVSGGIAFATPPTYGPMASNGVVYELNEKAEDKWKAWEPAITLHLTGKSPPTNSTPDLNSMRHSLSQK